MGRDYLQARASLRLLSAAEAMNSFPLQADPVVLRHHGHSPPNLTDGGDSCQAGFSLTPVGRCLHGSIRGELNP